MKVLYLLIFFISTQLNCFSQNQTDTISISKSGGVYFFQYGEEYIRPYSKKSILGTIDESRMDYLVGRKHFQAAGNSVLLGAVVFFSSFLYRDTKYFDAGMITGGIISLHSLFHMPKAKRNIKQSVLKFNQRIKSSY